MDGASVFLDRCDGAQQDFVKEFFLRLGTSEHTRKEKAETVKTNCTLIEFLSDQCCAVFWLFEPWVGRDCSGNCLKQLLNALVT